MSGYVQVVYEDGISRSFQSTRERGGVATVLDSWVERHMPHNDWEINLVRLAQKIRDCNGVEATREGCRMFIMAHRIIRLIPVEQAEPEQGAVA